MEDPEEPQAALTPRDLYARYAPAMAFIAVETPEGEERIGSAFHVGEGVFVTARHVTDGNRILTLATTEGRYVTDPHGQIIIGGKPGTYSFTDAGNRAVVAGPYYHPDPSVDVGALVTTGPELPVLPLGGHLDDWINDSDWILSQVLIMGYPPIPFSGSPLLVAASAEVNTIVDKYSGRHPHFVISAMARGGFSGGVCLMSDFVLGVITESLTSNGQVPELGFMAALTIEPIYECLAHHRILPEIQKELWDGLWDRPLSEK